MSTTKTQPTKDFVAVSFKLPKEAYERAEKIAARESRPLSELWPQVVSEGLAEHESIGELLERASESYCAQLKSEGKLHRTDEEFWAEQARIRQEIADQLYPSLPASVSVSP